jgi:uncharacterized membrane protein
LPEDEAPDAKPVPQYPAYSIFGGEDLGRILSLSDGVFAFALTLLVLDLTIPTFAMGSSPTPGMLAHKLQGEWQTFLGYGFSFLMISVWWMAHTRTFQSFAKFDGTIVWANMVLLFQVAVMPFVLEVYGSFPGNYVAVDLFAVIQIGLGLTNVLLWWHGHEAKLLKPGSEQVAIYARRRGLLISAFFALSIGLAFWNVSAAQYSWVLVFIVPRALTRRLPF